MSAPVLCAVFAQPLEWQARMDEVQGELDALLARLGEIAAAGPTATPDEVEEWRRLWRRQVDVLDPARAALLAEGQRRYTAWLAGEGDRE